MSRGPRRRLVPLLAQTAALGTAAMTLGFLLATAPPALAQTMSNSLGGFSQKSGEPIDIESDVLVVHDAQKYATFKGSVKAVQGGTTLRAKELDVHYVGGGSDALSKGSDASAAAASPDAKPAEPKAAGLGSDGTQISKIEARGEVVITSDQDQTTTSDWALYDVPAQLVTVGGNVVLMQGKNVLKGDRLVIDLKTGESRFENKGNTAAGGRIRALFMPKQDTQSGDTKPAKDKPKKDAGSSGPGDEEAPSKVPNDGGTSPAAEAWQLLPGQQQ